MDMRKGIFITFEGSDGCGKSTQAAMLAEYLAKRGVRALLSREPGGCPISERIRGLVLDAKVEGMSDTCEALLFAAARAQHVCQVIRPALLRGEIVLCDRFVDSSVAYQGAGRELGMDCVRRINAPAVGDCMPDRTVLLNIDPDESMRRRLKVDAPDRIEREKDCFTHRVARGYLDLAAAEPKRFRVVDATGTQEAVFARVLDAVGDLLK